jgi:L,D-peptidoglycan transpeptidase YkuD (ErfK/YbiS/YcfS/YnhG family)
VLTATFLALVVAGPVAYATLRSGTRPAHRAHAALPVTETSSLVTSGHRPPPTTTTAPPPTTTTAPPPTTTTAPPPAATTTVPPPTPTPSPQCSSGVANDLASTGVATQMIVVEAPTYATTYATVSAWQREGPCWTLVLGPWTGRIGASGFSDHHVEGDDTTPTGAYGIEPVMYGNAPNPGVQYQYQQLVCGDWWDETPSSPEYNTFQYVPCGTAPPFGGGSEALWEETTAYPSFAVVEYNTSPVVPGAGSAIFLHATVGGPTAGCVSLPLTQLDDVLRWLDPAATPLIVMGPSSEIDTF